MSQVMIDVDKIPREHMDHLGDGVYAIFDGYSIWLHANHHKNPTDVICLEPAVLEGLADFAKRMQK